MKKPIVAVLIGIFVQACSLKAQDSTKKWYALSNFYGSLESNIQYYVDDNKTGIKAPPKNFASNSYANLNYRYLFIDAGIQIENYNPRLQGFSDQLDSTTKLVHRFIRLKHKWAELTVGNFYDQLGEGYLFRSYEERQLGIDNIMDGVHVKLNPLQQLRLKAFTGSQRNFMKKSPGKIWGADAEYDFEEIGKKKNITLTIGLGYLLKKQQADVPIENFPQSVYSIGTRAKLTGGKYAVAVEFVTKSIEPDFQNAYIFKKGSAFLLTQSYTHPNGWGATVSLRRLENMDFKSDYVSTNAVASLNYLPALTKQHSYLVANIYPYATQWLAEMGGQADFFKLFKKKTLIGGNYGAKLTANFSFYNNLDTARIGNSKNFTSKTFAIGKQKLFRDFNVSFEKRWSKLVKASFTYMYLFYNKPVLLGGGDAINANIGIVDLLFNLSKKYSIRTEIQHLFTKDDDKNWVAGLLEFNTSKGVSIFISDLIDYQNKKISYYNIGGSYTKNSFRILLSASRQRAGLICVGGLCRFTPSFSGLNANIFYTF